MNRQTKLLTAVLAVGSLLLLSGCASYKAMSLPQLAKYADSSENSKTKNITLEHKVFDKADCKTYLGRKNILRKGYQPVQLALTNNTDRSYAYSATSLSLPIVPSEIVAKKVKFSTAGRVLGYNVAAGGFFATSIPLALLCIDLVVPGAGIAAICCLGASTVFFTAGVTDGVKSHKANQELAVDFRTKTLPLNGILKPYQTVNGIVVVPKKSFNPNFTFTLNDIDTNKAVVLNSTSDYVEVK